MGKESQTPAADAGSGGATSLRDLCHEMRQPLGVAMGYVSMLEDGAFGELPEEARGILGTVVTRLEALNEIIERRLDAPATTLADPA
ncbi:MAG: histidine kinase dimerization/phospho-acceptor domain-containing protein [Candidatus Dormibacteria bacterium]